MMTICHHRWKFMLQLLQLIISNSLAALSIRIISLSDLKKGSAKRLHPLRSSILYTCDLALVLKALKGPFYAQKWQTGALLDTNHDFFIC